MEPQYAGGLVAVSVVVAIVASYVALDLTARLTAARQSASPRWEQVSWGLGGAAAMGTGIWSMHFIAMLALRLPYPIRYGVGLLIASILPAIAASGLALFISSRPKVAQHTVFVGGLCMGVGIAAMHYTGMAAIVTPTGVHYHAGLWWLSVAIAVVASWAALTLAFHLRGHAGLWIPRRGLAAVVMGFAIAGMHYTGMAAARFPVVRADAIPAPQAGVLATAGLALAVTIGSLSILGLALLSAAVSIRMRAVDDARRARTEEMLRRTAAALAVTGPAFLPTALAELARVLSADLAVIARVESGVAHTLVLMRRGVLVPDIAIPLDNGPFMHATRSPAVHVIPSGVGQLFREPWLSEIDAVGYAGVPIFDPEQNLVGLIGVFTSHELVDSGETEAVLQVFATRVAGEMQQRRIETALKESEHRLFQIEKMEAIGQLAGGVAHDFNNMLTVILGYGEELLDGTAGSQAASHLREMMTAAERSQQLTQQLLAFSRSQVLRPQAVVLDEAVASLQSMLRRIIGEDIEIVTTAAAHGAAIHADPGQLSQVLMNLAVNARDAMPAGGTLAIETARAAVAVPISTGGTRTIPPGRYVRLSVRDSGHGMDAATRDRIFEPFFSTKGERGTGLGLATVYGIVRQSNGYIACDSHVGRGTTFTIYFPETDKSVPLTAPESLPGPAPKGKASILIVEDEKAVRQFLATALARRDYEVESAASAPEALAMLQSGWKPDLLLTDYVLPGGMTGGNLARAAAASHPGVRTILMSGYAKEPISDGDIPGVHAFLQKPFTPDVLDTTIRQVLSVAV